MREWSTCNSDEGGLLVQLMTNGKQIPVRDRGGETAELVEGGELLNTMDDEILFFFFLEMDDEMWMDVS